MKKLIAVLLPLIIAGCSYAQVMLPQLIRDSMILQRDAPVNLWGWAAANEKVTVRLKGKSFKTKADAAGNWKVQLPSQKAGGPYNIQISASNNITISNVLFGDVWFCSGQSNMVHQLNIHDVTYAAKISTANFPEIRQFLIPTLANLQAPQQDLPAGYWNAAIGENVRPFSAVAYFFAKQLYQKYHVPIGIINASVGGTPIEAWTSEEGLKDIASAQQIIQQNKDTGYINSTNRSAANYRNSLPPLPPDAGLTATVKWFDPGYAPKGWRTINIPGYWEDQGLKNLNGTVWYRKEIEIPAAMAGKPARVFLGRIVDADELYIDGILIGKTTYQYPQRRYTVPANILKTGKNIFVVRVTNTSGKGGFVPGKPYFIFAGADTVDLKGDWLYKVGAVYRPLDAEPTAAVNSQYQPTALYNAMVAPVINYNIKGICWYQGEANTNRPKEYEKLLQLLIKDWRSKWKHDWLPFLYVQLPGFMDYNYLPSESNWAELRESQRKALTVPNTAMAVAIDLGEWNDIHPDNKKDVGERLALAAMKVAYKENIVYSGPIFQSAEVKGDKIVVHFSNTGSGLTTNDGEPVACFTIAGADKKFVWATAVISEDSIIVSANGIAQPKYVRYAWADNPVNPNLFNKEARPDGSVGRGLPASPFKTDE